MRATLRSLFYRIRMQNDSLKEGTPPGGVARMGKTSGAVACGIGIEFG